MKLKFFAAVGLLCLMACNQTSTSTSADSTATTSSGEAVNYAYTLNHSPEWQWGSNKNTEVALNALKGFETGDIAGTMQYWGDSVKLEFDNFDKKVSNDSLKAMFTAWRGNSTEFKVEMQDYESVISKDKEWEWVSLWYKQVMTNAKGEVDSMECMDDLRFKDGKIVLLNEKTRKLGPPKK